jgi:Fe-S-cluster containining protein
MISSFSWHWKYTLDDFNCQRCGGCCTVSGYVRLKEGEARRIADFLDLDLREFTDRYTRLTEDRTCLSLIERPDRSCIFHSPRNGCTIQPVKPHQCATFPVAWRFDGWEVICRGSTVH